MRTRIKWTLADTYSRNEVKFFPKITLSKADRDKKISTILYDFSFSFNINLHSYSIRCMYNMLNTFSWNMQCSVFFTISFTFLFTWVFIQLMAFSGPINLYQTGIFKPYPPPSIHSFAIHLTADGTNNLAMSKTDKMVYSSFLDHALQISCHGKLLPQTYRARFFFWCNFQITVSSFWCPDVHVGVVTANKTIDSECVFFD